MKVTSGMLSLPRTGKVKRDLIKFLEAYPRSVKSDLLLRPLQGWSLMLI
jgi:hypothetical protein